MKMRAISGVATGKSVFSAQACTREFAKTTSRRAH